MTLGDVIVAIEAAHQQGVWNGGKPVGARHAHIEDLRTLIVDGCCTDFTCSEPQCKFIREVVINRLRSWGFLGTQSTSRTENAHESVSE